MKVRRLFTAALAVIAVGAVGVVGMASAASAESYEFYKGDYSGTCIDVPQSGSTVVYLKNCVTGDWSQQFVVTAVSVPGTHGPIRTLKNRDHGNCLDVNGTNALPAAKPCTSSNDQRWEIFHNSDGSTTFKSWGAWVNRSQHTCLANEATGDGTFLRKATCNAASNQHQWK